MNKKQNQEKKIIWKKMIPRKVKCSKTLTSCFFNFHLFIFTCSMLVDSPPKCT